MDHWSLFRALFRRRGSQKFLSLALALAVLPAAPPLAAAAAPPSPGAVLQQTLPPPVAPAAPPVILALPAAPQQRSQSQMLVPVHQIIITGNHLLPTALLHQLVAPAEGKRITLGALQGYAGQITDAYHAHGYPLAYAYFPPQTVHDGVIQIAVVEPSYDQIEVTGKSRLRPSVVRRTVGVQPGAPVTTSALNRGLLLLAQTPGIRVDGVLLPGAAPQTTTLQLTRHDLPVLSATVSETNDGNRYTGSDLTNETVSANDPFGYGSAFAVNGIESGTGGLKEGGFSILSPNIDDGVRAGFYGSGTEYNLGGRFKDLVEHGRETELGGDVSAPVVLEPGREIDVRLDVLEDWIGQSSRPTATLTQQMISIERLTADGAWTDRWNGVTSGSIALSTGYLTITPAAATVTDGNGPRAAGGFELVQLNLQHDQNIGRGFALDTDFQGQYAGKNLDSSQQFYLGGPYGVMSYAAGEGGGDEGYLATATLSHAIALPKLPGALMGSVLAQTGTVQINHTKYAGFTGPNSLTESGVGFGVVYSWGPFNASVHDAVMVSRNTSPTAGRNQCWFQLSFSL